MLTSAYAADVKLDGQCIVAAKNDAKADKTRDYKIARSTSLHKCPKKFDGDQRPATKAVPLVQTGQASRASARSRVRMSIFERTDRQRPRSVLLRQLQRQSGQDRRRQARPGLQRRSWKKGEFKVEKKK